MKCNLRDQVSAPLSFAIRRVVRSPARAMDLVVRIYQLVLSPLKQILLGPSSGCRFYPTCSHYARESLRRHGIVAGSVLTVRRIMRCHPFRAGGLDPVPDALCWHRRRGGNKRSNDIDRESRRSTGPVIHG